MSFSHGLLPNSVPKLHYTKTDKYIRNQQRGVSVTYLIARLDSICNTHQEYDVDKQRENNVPGGDYAFARLYTLLEADLNQALQRSEAAAAEKNRATAVAIYAEIRRTKALLLEQVPKLERLALKKVRGFSTEEFKARNDLVTVLKENIEAIADGSTGKTNRTGAEPAPLSTGIVFDATSDARFSGGYYRQTEQSNNFRKESEMRWMKQDQGLEVIAEGLDTLKNMAHDMNEELDRQVPLMDEIDDKVEKATSDLGSTNVRLKDTVTKLR